jgi:hypothetical protein
MLYSTPPPNTIQSAVVLELVAPLRSLTQWKTTRIMTRMPEELSSIIDSARAKLQAELDLQLGVVANQHRQTVELARRTAEQAADERWLAKLKTAEEGANTAARAAEEAATHAREAMEQTLSTIRHIESARTVSEILTAISHGVSARVSRSALFVLEGDLLVEWTPTGAQPLTQAPIRFEDPSAGVLSAALRNRVTARDVVPPALGASGSERTATAIPLFLEGVPVAVVYAEEGRAAASVASLLETLELVAAHGATRLGYVTAVRTAQAMRWIAGGAASVSNPRTAIAASSSIEEEEQSAKRYARLLISEIKLYNEAAVRTGREQRDLLKRLQPEVERARRLYEHRVPATLRGRAQHFDHELVQTLAGGDALLLG